MYGEILSHENVKSLKAGDEVLITLHRGELRLFVAETAAAELPESVTVRSILGQPNTYRATVRLVKARSLNGGIVHAPWLIFTFNNQCVGMSRLAWASCVGNPPNPEGDIVMKRLPKCPRRKSWTAP